MKVNNTNRRGHSLFQAINDLTNSITSLLSEKGREIMKGKQPSSDITEMHVFILTLSVVGC